MRMSILYNTIINKGLRVPFTSKDNEIAKGKQAEEGLVHKGLIWNRYSTSTTLYVDV